MSEKKLFDNSFYLDPMEWSYSRVSSFQQCPMYFYLQYIEENERSENAFAQWGTLMHSIFERYFTGKADLWDLSEIYMSEYDHAVTERFPFRKMEDSYHDRGIEYLDSFEGKIADEKKIISVEERYHSKIGEFAVVGVVDLIAENDNGLVVCDTKCTARDVSSDCVETETLCPIFAVLGKVFRAERSCVLKKVSNFT